MAAIVLFNAYCSTLISYLVSPRLMPVAKTYEDHKNLSLEDLSGPFILLVSGLSLSLLVFFLYKLSYIKNSLSKA